MKRDPHADLLDVVRLMIALEEATAVPADRVLGALRVGDGLVEINRQRAEDPALTDAERYVAECEADGQDHVLALVRGALAGVAA